MEQAKLEKLFELISELVNQEGPWADKKAEVLKAASDADQTNLQEFVTWFGEE